MEPPGERCWGWQHLAQGNQRGTKVPILCHCVKASVLGMAFKLRGSNNPSEKEFLAFLWLTQRQISDSTEISRADFDLLSLNERMMPKGLESLSCCTLLKSMRQHHVMPAEDTAWFILFLGCKCEISQCNWIFWNPSPFALSCLSPNYLVQSTPGRKFRCWLWVILKYFFILTFKRNSIHDIVSNSWESGDTVRGINIL